MQNSGPGSAGSERHVLTIIWPVGSGGHTYEVRVTQTSGGSLNVLGVRSSYFMIAQLI